MPNEMTPEQQRSIDNIRARLHPTFETVGPAKNHTPGALLYTLAFEMYNETVVTTMYINKDGTVIPFASSEQRLVMDAAAYAIETSAGA